MTSRFKQVILPTILLTILGLFLLTYSQRWVLYDWLRLRDYSPSSTVIALATDTTMNPSARHIFYVYHPELENKQVFNDHCGSSEQTIVLGCYIAGKGIYIDNISDERLNGVLQVTAAHEMLHAAYDRLSDDEKQSVGKMLNDTYAHLNDERIKRTIADYQKSGADITNELHSILGTEVRNLPQDLETYYKRYFSDRSKVVGYSEKYETAFTSRKVQVASYDSQLQTLKQQIDIMQSSLGEQFANINQQLVQLNSYRTDRNFKAYNSGVPVYNSLVTKYNQDVIETQALISQYNKLLAKRNNLALEENELIKAIDSRPTTIDEQ